MKICSAVLSCLGTVAKRLGEGISAICAGLVARISSIWNRRPTEPAAPSDYSWGDRTVTVNPDNAEIEMGMVMERTHRPLEKRTELGGAWSWSSVSSFSHERAAEIGSEEGAQSQVRTESPTLVQASGDDLERTMPGEVVQPEERTDSPTPGIEENPAETRAKSPDSGQTSGVIPMETTPEEVVQTEVRTEPQTPGQTSDVVPGQTTSEVVVQTEVCNKQSSGKKKPQQWTHVKMAIGSASYQPRTSQRPWNTLPPRKSPKNDGR